MVEIATSILNAKKEKIIDTIYDLEKAKTDYFHIDVMDGEFVKMIRMILCLNIVST